MAKYELTGGGAEYWKRERKKRRNERMKIKSDKNVKGTRSDGSAESRKANRARKDKLKAKKRGQAEKRLKQKMERGPKDRGGKRYGKDEVRGAI